MANDRIWLWFGLDVSKESFTAASYCAVNGRVCFPKAAGFPMNGTGARQFLTWRKSILNIFPSLAECHAVAMESTGPYSRRLMTLLLRQEPELYVSICNPHAVSLYTRSHRPDKSDKADAEFIARYGFDAQPPKTVQREEKERHLKELVRMRRQLIKMQTKLKNSKPTREFKDIQAMSAKVIADLGKQIKDIEKKMDELVATIETAKTEIQLMTTVPGVAKLSAAVIYAEMGSLTQYSRKQLSSLSGLCPANRQSGTSLKSSRLSRRGSPGLRQILYLDTTSAMRKIESIAKLRQRLLAREKSTKMTARCACMRKLLLIIRGVVVSGKPFEPNHTSSHPVEKSHEVA